MAQHLHTPDETVRQAVNRLEAAGYLAYDDGLFVTDDRVREAARDLLAASAGLTPSIEEAYVLPQLGDWPFAFARIAAVYNRGVATEVPGRYFVGLRRMYRLSSALFGGVGRDVSLKETVDSPFEL